ncbi:hypothetical protein ACJJTC_008029 [Scirpophaga incertulas]
MQNFKVESCFMLVALFWCFSLTLSSASVYIVTPSPRSHSNEGRSAPFYYHNWMRRMDMPQNVTTSTTPKTKTHDLIFAEFEADSGDHMQKSIKKLLEKERVIQNTISSTTTTTTTSSRPVMMLQNTEILKNESDETNYFKMYNNLYNDGTEHIPTTTVTSTTETKPPQPTNVENVWHIIDSEKRDQYSGAWEELPVGSPNNLHNAANPKPTYDITDEHFVLPGLQTNPRHGAENESRAIRTDSDVRFPYVSLKPFQIKNANQPITNVFSNRQKTNIFTNLDQFKEIKNPVRGEVQDIVPTRQIIERYNPAQPYLPPESGSKSKQATIVKTVSNLVPPPPPPPPKVTGEDFPIPPSYESFPPYSDTSPNVAPALSINSGRLPINNDESDQIRPNVDYRYKPSVPFLPTVPPVSKPPSNNFYKPNIDTVLSSPIDEYTYTKPSVAIEPPPHMDVNSHTYSKPKEEFQHNVQHSYNPTYFTDESDYPDLIFNKPHAGSNDNKAESGMQGNDDMKNNDDMKEIGMMAPPLPPPQKMKPDMDSGPPTDNHGFPPDFPGDLKFQHQFDDHDYFYHDHHLKTTTTTTTTTESPRENRFSYYYLGKKLYYLPLYFSVYFIVYVGALIIKAVLRHKIVYPNSWRPNGTTATFLSKRSLNSWDFPNETLHEVTGRVTKAIAQAAEQYIRSKSAELR